ncbi:MAG TPA: hypothetical protein VJT73_19830 [Polyangiaceae bacterium]|nr:hypothetical protein [Polyangiaceae bacterium]
MAAKSTIDSPAGGVELYRSLCCLADEYRMRAVAERDYDAAALAMALHTLALQASRSGVHLHMMVVHEGGA